MSARISPRASAFCHAGFRHYWIARFLGCFSAQIMGVSVGWQVYDITRDPFDLGMVGLTLFLPAFLLVLVTGAVADRFNRVLIMTGCIAGEGLCALALLMFTVTGEHSVVPIFCTLALLGTLRAFFGPALQSLMPNLVPAEDLASAIAWGTSSWQIATVFGPVAGGLLYGISPEAAYISSFVLLAVAAALALRVPVQAHVAAERPSLETVVAGFRYIWKEKIVLGAISFDLFAMLLGGASALLPVYARDILTVGPWGLGLLRAAPGIGSILVAALLLRHPVKDHAGVIMFVCVALVGVFIIVFGASTEVWLSVLALGLMGGLDMVSVFVRETLIQLRTPDALRGRVNAVNMVFTGASNELGEFRAGISASAFGAVPAVIIGGAATIGVSALWWHLFPQLRKARSLGDGRRVSSPVDEGVCCPHRGAAKIPA
ncbi:MFS family enterobactin exporter EntS protein (plasmid) [Rhizobium sp. CIAT894]|uniref:MFS transporter n=1 Tax=Rhizobium sp. CIAT894 TaxID=2020312 RepID=UPI000A200B23|nr:MFS transporter [Rhizobium sp. CIAT894]ARM91549.1 MFS family enterobactin exporter EntS protein [Rhizobium sp. CIAT894]